MLCKVVGVQKQDFTLDNGYHFAGRKVHAIDLEKQADGLDGNTVTMFKLSNDIPKLAILSVVVGKTYEVYFEQDGKTVAFLRESAPAVNK